jgi:secretion/DNA translocation related CpaE-like protein
MAPPDTTPTDALHRPARLVAVVGACGGAGTSVVAATLARAWRRRGAGATLVDLDVPGAGIEVLLGTEDERGSRWTDLTDARGTVDGAALLGTLPRWGAVPVLSGSRHDPHPPADDVVLDTTTALLRAGERVVLDLPRPPAWTATTRSLLAAADDVVLVVPLTVSGAAGAVATTAALTGAGVDGPVVVARGPAPGRVDPTSLGRALGRPVDVVVGWDPGVAAAVEHGAGPAPRRRGRLHRAATGLAALVDVQTPGPPRAVAPSVTRAGTP